MIRPLVHIGMFAAGCVLVAAINIGQRVNREE